MSKNKKDEKDWVHGRAESPMVEYLDVLGPIIQQCKVSAVRKLSNRIVARAEIHNYRAEYSTEILLVTAAFIDGEWVVFGAEWFCEFDVKSMRAVLDCEVDPCELVSVRAFFFVNAQGIGTMQQAYPDAMMLWNVWGRHDGLDEQRFVPVDDFYDNVPLPSEEQLFFPEDEEEWNGEYPFSPEEEEYYAKLYGDD